MPGHVFQLYLLVVRNETDIRFPLGDSRFLWRSTQSSVFRNWEVLRPYTDFPLYSLKE